MIAVLVPHVDGCVCVVVPDAALAPVNRRYVLELKPLLMTVPKFPLAPFILPPKIPVAASPEIPIKPNPSVPTGASVGGPVNVTVTT